MAVYTSSPIEGRGGERALAEAWEQARPHFNHCPRCGRWVSDLMFHPAAGACVECAPWETAPGFCPRCGAVTEGNSLVCEVCGLVLSDPKGE